MSEKIAVITGGQGDLARAVGRELEASGFTVIAPGRRDLDVRDATGVEKFFSCLDCVDLLVNNAGVARDALCTKMTEADWDTVLDTNLNGAARCCRAAARSMVGRRHGHLLNIGSFSALGGVVGQVNYSAAKAGLVGLTRSLAAELGGQNIRVNCVLPGFLDTRFTRGVTPGRRAAVEKAHTLGRFNTTVDAARFVAFLDSLENVSGQVFQLDSRISGW